jgi:hypothetical protein
MIKVIIKGKEYDVPVSWNEVPYVKGVEVIELMKQEKQDDILCLLIGIDIETLHSLKAHSVAQLFSLTEFYLDLALLDNNEPKDKYKDINYGSLPYGETEAIKIIISNGKDKDFMQLAPDVLKKITGDDISNEPFSEVIGSVGFFLNQWIAFTKDLQNLTKAKQTSEANLQGLNDLNDSGVLELG